VGQRTVQPFNVARSDRDSLVKLELQALSSTDIYFTPATTENESTYSHLSLNEKSAQSSAALNYKL